MFTTFGALLGLAVAIVLIIKNFNAVYSLILGALVGGLVGSFDLLVTVSAMIKGSQSMMSPVLRILTSGVLAGCLVKTGAAEKIADTITRKLGEKKALVAIAIATMVICAVGVFIDIAVITTAPIALAVGKNAGLSKSSILLAMIGGGKAGNVISPNPNTIATAEGFGLSINTLMYANIIPAIVALIVTVLLASLLKKKTDRILDIDVEKLKDEKLPSFFASIVGPLTVVILLALRPIAKINIDPLIALPLGGIVCLVATSKLAHTKEYVNYGFTKVIGVCALLIGTGTIAGIIKNSNLQLDVINIITSLNLPAFILAPVSGILMGAATASTTAGSTIATQTFAKTLLNANVPAISAAAMIHAGATVLDSLPQGSFFHATGGAVKQSIQERLKLIPYEALVGLSTTVVAVLIYVIF